MIDLHTHSTASDGQYSPEELIKKAADLKIQVMALTDHDTLAGLNLAAKTAHKEKIIFIPGIELNIDRPGCEFHLLGLGLKQISDNFNKLVNELQESRFCRNNEIVEKMKSSGIETNLQEIQSFFAGQNLGRPHFAKWLVLKGFVKNVQAAFDKYLGRGRPWYVERVGADLDKSIAGIYESGGVPVIAHPLSLYLSWNKIEPVLEDFKNRGIAGLEAYHPGARIGEAKHLEEIANRLGLFVTGGSDFHGESVRKDRKLGHASGNEKISDRLWFENLKPALEERGWLF